MDARDVPLLEFDPDPTAVIEPHMIHELRDVPEHAVMCFFSDVIERIRDRGTSVLFELQAAHGVHPVYELDVDSRRLAAFHPGVGAPLAGAFFDESIAGGCRKFVAVGGAGSLRPELTVGHVVVPTAALRDEGTSFHYAPPSREIEAQPAAVAAVEETLRANDVPYVTGKAWTTDAFYRETRAKVARRVNEGCVVVDMEASALFAIAAFRGVELGYVLAAADSLAGHEWDDRGFIDDTDVRERLFWLAAEACLCL